MRRTIGLAVGSALIAWIVASVVLVALAGRDAASANDELQSARARLQPAGIAEGAPIGHFERAVQQLDRAHDRLDSPVMAPWSVVPVAGRQLRSMRALTGAGLDAARIGRDVSTSARSLLDGDLSSGAGRLATLDEVDATVRDAEDRIGRIDLGPHRGLLPTLARNRNRAADDLRAMGDAVVRTREAVRALGELLRGPSTLLLAASNNAEMRAGSGAILSIGTVTLADGEMTVSAIRPTTDVDVDPADVPIAGDLAERWAFTEPNTEWRNLAMTPRFDATAELAGRMWQAATGEEVDGVLLLDVSALRGLVAATRPVTTADGRRLEADDVHEYLMRDQYRQFDDSDRGQEARRDQLGAIAASVIDALETGAFDAGVLMKELTFATTGRHLLLWSANDDFQRGWSALGVDGVLRDDSLLVSVINRGANKLDRFLRADGELALVDRTPDGTARYEVTVHLDNRTPDGEPRYIAGPGVDDIQVPGEYLGLVALTVPGIASATAVEDQLPTVVAGADGPTRVIVTEVRVPPKTTADVRFTFELPASVSSVRIEPSARIPAMRWRVGDESFRDTRSRSVPLPTTIRAR